MRDKTKVSLLTTFAANRRKFIYVTVFVNVLFSVPKPQNCVKNVTIKTLAKELKVSVATVSKAFRDSHEISAATKQRVLERAAEMDYVPNPYAGSLRRRKSKTIAVVLPEVADSFFSLAINGIEAVAQEKGYHVLVYLTHESFEKEKAVLKDLQSGRVDGVLMSVTAETTGGAHVQTLFNTGMPVVFFDRVCDDVSAPKITTNDAEAACLATEHLMERGCRKICLLSASDSLSISHRRTEGFLKALGNNHRKLRAPDVVLCSNDAEKSYAVIKKKLASAPRPDGIVATVEKLIAPVYTACAGLGLSIPEDVKVVGFSNLPTAPILNPSLTTVTQPAFEMGKAAAAVLLKALNKKVAGWEMENTMIASVLEVRRSTA